MPSGNVKWFDPKTDEGRVESGTREYVVRGEDMEPRSRVPGARIHFDVKRQGGIVRATEVRLREGTRVSSRQGRFGDLVGAAHPDEKGRRPLTHGRPDLELALRLPMEVARRWVLAMEEGDLEMALLLYAPDARVHVGSDTFEGHPDVQGYLPECPLLGLGGDDVELRGEDDVARIAWHPSGDQPGGETRLRILHGQIVEQWIVPSGTE